MYLLYIFSKHFGLIILKSFILTVYFIILLISKVLFFIYFYLLYKDNIIRINKNINNIFIFIFLKWFY